MSTETCGTIFTRKDFIDETGYYIEWEDDYNCTCGCWDDEDDLNNVCKIYSKLTYKEAKEKLKA